jgi:hypothetical protein
VKSSDFVDARLWALRFFFRQEFGPRWQYLVAKEMGRKARPGPFRYPKRGVVSLKVLQSIEDVAITHGFNPHSRLALLPRPLKLSSEASATVPGL